MFDHVTIRVTDTSASERFYGTVLARLGIERMPLTGAFAGWQELWLAGADDSNPPTRPLHLGFGASSHELVEEFWRVGTGAGYANDGRPGPRPQYRSDYYGAFLLDPDGNSVEAVHHGGLRRSGIIDHVWIRVADVPAARRFYETSPRPPASRSWRAGPISSASPAPRGRSPSYAERRPRTCTSRS